MEKGVEVNGYLDIGVTRKNSTGLNEAEIKNNLKGWKKMGVYGVLLDNIQPEYGTTIGRIKKYSYLAYTYELSVIYNVNLWHLQHGHFAGLNFPTKDTLMIEPFAFGNGKEYEFPVIPYHLTELQRYGLQIYGVSTYNSAQAEEGGKLKRLFNYCKNIAEKVGLNGFGFTDSSYSVSGNLNGVLINFFEKK